MIPLSGSSSYRAARTRARSSPLIRRLALLMLLAVMIFDVVFYLHPIWVVEQMVQLRLRAAGVQSRYVMAGSYRVHYLVGGSGTPLLLIHGLGSRAEDWAPEIPGYINRGFRVYAVDLLGYGNTDRPNVAYTMDEQADLLRAFLQAVHIQQPDVAGWSMGGWVALKFTLQHPEMVRRLVLMDSAGLRFQTSVTPELFEPRTIPQLKRLEAVLVPHPVWLPEFFERDLLRRMARNFPVVDRTVRSMLTGQDLVDGQLGAIRVPVLIVWGAEDALIPPQVGERMQREIPGSDYVSFAGCGHLAPATCSSEIVPRVVRFLQSRRAPGP